MLTIQKKEKKNNLSYPLSSDGIEKQIIASTHTKNKNNKQKKQTSKKPKQKNNNATWTILVLILKA